MMFWVPQSGDIGMGVSILSYDGAVQFGVVTRSPSLSGSRSADRAFCSRVREAGSGDAALAVAVERATGRTDDGECAFRSAVARRRIEVRGHAGELDRAAYGHAG